MKNWYESLITNITKIPNINFFIKTLDESIKL